MLHVPMYPLRFEPIYQYRLWGGRRLADLLAAPLPGDGPIGEAWLLSDRDDHSSRVADGPLKGSTIRQLMEQSPDQMLGNQAARFKRFPLLLKFLDARDKLSVQVHPADGQRDYIPAGESGKTEAWVVLEAGPGKPDLRGPEAGHHSRRSGAGARGSDGGGPATEFHAAESGDAVFIRAGTVHSLSGLVVFEVQENSDVTFRLYDWDRIDPKTGKPRPLQVEQALACIDYAQGAVGPVAPVVEATTPVRRERLFACAHFRVWRHSGRCAVRRRRGGRAARSGVHRRRRASWNTAVPMYAIGTGDVLLLPAAVGACVCRPSGEHDASGNRDPGGTMKKLIVFDLDGTLAESKSSIDDEMSARLCDLLGVVSVAVISGGDWPQFDKQVLSRLPHDDRLKRLSILPTCGTKFFQYDGSWKKTLFGRFHR